MPKNPAKSLFWITSIFEKHRVPFVIAGGLAAKAYGSSRPLNDIDIDIHHADFDKIIPDIKPYITYGPDHYVGAKWDLPLITLMHEGQEIDISAGDKVRIFDSKEGQWKNFGIDTQNARIMDIFGISVPIISPQELIAYKSLLDGEHQAEDITAAKRFLALLQN